MLNANGRTAYDLARRHNGYSRQRKQHAAAILDAAGGGPIPRGVPVFEGARRREHPHPLVPRILVD
eukprot:1839404-Pleurochrysis_carterae.AAC.1